MLLKNEKAVGWRVYMLKYKVSSLNRTALEQLGLSYLLFIFVSNSIL